MTNDTEDRKQYARLNREVKRSISKAKNEEWEIKCEEIDTCIGSTKSRAAWKVIKSLRTNSCLLYTSY